MDAVELAEMIEELDDADLDVVYRRCQFIRSARVRMLSPGQEILWHDKHKREWTGTVERVNRKTVTLSDTNHPKYGVRGVRVPLAWVRAA